jgi:hypothetical protein
MAKPSAFISQLFLLQLVELQIGATTASKYHFGLPIWCLDNQE